MGFQLLCFHSLSQFSLLAPFGSCQGKYLAVILVIFSLCFADRGQLPTVGPGQSLLVGTDHFHPADLGLSL